VDPILFGPRKGAPVAPLPLFGGSALAQLPFPGLPRCADRPGELAGEPAVYFPPLGNNASSATPPLLPGSIDAAREAGEWQLRQRRAVRLREQRALRWTMRRSANRLTKRKNVAKCGRCRYQESTVGLAVGEGGAYFTGVVRCGSVWECPVCMHTISSRRSEEVRETVARHRATGGGAYMLTLTLPHDAGDELRAMRKHVTKAWSKVQAGEPYKRVRERIGLVGTIRALEVTHGPNGWHPHLHILVLTKVKCEDRATGEIDAAGRAYVDFVYRRWADHVTRRNEITGKIYRAPTREHGVSFVVSHKDEYISKLGLADEVTRGSWKKAAEFGGYRTPLQILHDHSRTAYGTPENKRAAALWGEYADAMVGAKQLTWSRGLRKLYEMGEEQTDLEIVEAETEAPAVHYISADVWDGKLKWNMELQLRLLYAADCGGIPAVMAEIDVINGLSRVPF